MGYRTPSHDVTNKPGDEGSCPPMKTESINGKDFPNGDNPSLSFSGELAKSEDKGLHGQPLDSKGKGGADPTPAMPGA